MDYPKGSEWRKWDLHIHTPSSVLNSQFKGWDSYFNALKNSEELIKVIGITDYYSIEGYKEILKQKENLTNIDLIIPNIEFRITPQTKKASGINIHLLINPNDPEHLTKIESALSLLTFEFKGNQFSCTKNGLILFGREHDPSIVDDEAAYKEGANQFKISFEDFRKWHKSIGWLQDNSVIGVSNKTNDGVSGLSHEGGFEAVQEEVLRFSDFVFSSNPSDTQFFLGEGKLSRDELIEKYGTIKPCLHGSDAHKEEELFKPDLNRYCWIKADPTFSGLRHSLKEPEQRIYIGEQPPQLNYIGKNKEYYIDKISINTQTNDSEWFDSIGDIQLNPGLIAIIGNKGTGKSALSDSIALAGNTHWGQLNFLVKGRFLSIKSHKKYSVEILFKDKYQSIVSFDNPIPDTKKEEKVVYLSQSFVRELCENDKDVNLLQNAIDGVIFSHLPEEETYQQENLNDLIKIRARHFNETKQEHLLHLKVINRNIVELEDLNKHEHLEKLLNQEKEFKRQLEELEKTPIPEVKKPDQTGNKTQLKLLDKNSKWMDFLEPKIQENQEDLNEQLVNINNLESLFVESEGLQRGANEIIKGLKANPLVQKAKIRVEELITFKLDGDKIKEIIAESKLASNDNKSNIKRLKGFSKNAEKRIKAIREKLSGKDKEYQSYLSKLQEKKEKQKKLTGDNKTPNTLAYVQNRMTYIQKDVLEELAVLKEERRELAKQILKCTEEKENSLRNIYQFAQKEAEKQAAFFNIPINEFINFDTSIGISEKFNENFLDFIMQNRQGTFYGSQEGESQLQKIQNDFDIKEPAELIDYPDRILEALNHNMSADPEKVDESYKMKVENQLRANKTKLDLYDFLYSFEYIEARFMFTYDNKKLDLLSPGERGLLLLIFYLLISKDRRPIIIDQPEENLDNETVFRKLVTFIRKIKKQRQIIIVTHNPNLAVVCDADQTIFCKIDKKKKNLIEYKTGSIENSFLKMKSIDVLEGTKEAFDDRRGKYEILN